MSSLVKRSDLSQNVQSPLVKRGDLHSQAAHNLASTGDYNRQVYALHSVITDPQVRPILKKSNIFILGKIGFFDLVTENLKSGLRQNGVITTCRNETELKSMPGKDTNLSIANKKHPILLLPATKNREALNQLVVSALECQMPLWLVALPSQIEKHLLVAFDCFFLAPSPKREIDIIADITSITQDDREKLCDETSIQSLLVMSRPTSLGQPGHLGSVIYIGSLD